MAKWVLLLAYDQKFLCARESWAYRYDRSSTACLPILFCTKDSPLNIECLGQNMRLWITYSWQAAAFASVSLKFRHTSDPHHRESDVESQFRYLRLSCRFCYQVFPGLWLKFGHNWDLQSSQEWGSWICMKAKFDKLQLFMDGSFQPRHTSTATNMPLKHMYPVCSGLYIFVCFILIMFSLTLTEWTQCTQIVINQDTSHFGAGSSSRSASTNIWIYASSVCQGRSYKALNSQLHVNCPLEEGCPAEINHKCSDPAN